jgi:hypothetical protein
MDCVYAGSGAGSLTPLREVLSLLFTRHAFLISLSYTEELRHSDWQCVDGTHNQPRRGTRRAIFLIFMLSTVLHNG